MTLLKSTASFCACYLAVCAGLTGDDLKTLSQVRREVAASQSSEGGIVSPSGQLKLTVGSGTKPPTCPDPASLRVFKHAISYDRTEVLDPFARLNLLHLRIWERGPLTAFYLDDPLPTVAPNRRLVYMVDKNGWRAYFTCSLDHKWQECLENYAGLEAANDLERTCVATVNLRMVAAWEPSPNDQEKRQVADELRAEIEAKWQGAQQIVIRDFNLQDRQITMYIKMPDGDYYQGCSFHSWRVPHCGGWHLFGQAPVAAIRKRIFDKPYRLK